MCKREENILRDMYMYLYECIHTQKKYFTKQRNVK